jgi:transcriptional regulator with XRE-family HTH domain
VLAGAGDIRNARDIGYHLAQMRKQRGMTQAEFARVMAVSQARVSRMEHGDLEKMQVESVAAYVAAIGGHLRLVADFEHPHVHRLRRHAHRLSTRGGSAG